MRPLALLLLAALALAALVAWTPLFGRGAVAPLPRNVIRPAAAAPATELEGLAPSDAQREGAASGAGGGQTAAAEPAALFLHFEGIPEGLPVTWIEPRARVEGKEELEQVPGLFLRATRDGERTRTRGPSVAGPAHGGTLHLVWRDLVPGALEISGELRGHAGEAELAAHTIVLAPGGRAELSLRIGDELDVMALDVRGGDGHPLKTVTIGLSDGPTGQVYRCSRRTPGLRNPPPFIVVRKRGAFGRLFIGAEGWGEFMRDFAPGEHLVQLPELPVPVVHWVAPPGGTPAIELLFERDLPSGAWAPPYECLLDVPAAIDVSSRGMSVPLRFPGPGRYRAREAQDRISPFALQIAPGSTKQEIVLPRR